MNNITPYAKYKNTGVDWLDCIPEHWELTQLRWVADCENSNVDKKKYDGQTEVLLCNYVDVYYNEVISSHLSFMKATASLAEIKHFSLQENDVILTKDSESADDIGIPAVVGQNVDHVVCGYHLTHVKPHLAGDGPFIFRSIQSALSAAQFFVSAKGVTRYGLPVSAITNLYFCLPPAKERQQIAKFLDRETARIDALIEKKERQIELLEEKRQAVITQAVTKGLNSDSPMKDSGIEWLGDVPAHWKISRIKNVTFAIIDGPHFSPSYQDYGYMFISARNIKVDRWSLDDAKYISEANFHEFNKRVRPEIGDVLLTKGGTTGVARAVDLDIPFQVWVHVAVLKTLKSKIDPFYLAYALNGKSCYEQSQLFTRGATNNDLGLSRIAKIYFPAPSLEDQKRVVAFLDKSTKQIDSLITKMAESVELLQERRAALINAAVTGQIEVWEAA
jgi:type I restriction enzyme, S subunit